MRKAFVIVAVAGCAAREVAPAPAAATAPAVAPAAASGSAAATASASASSAEAKPKVVVISTANPPMVTVVQFPKGSAEMRAEARQIVDAVVATMHAHPEVELVQLEGHSIAGEPAAIAQERADAVRSLLVARGIAASRVRAKGFGAHCPRQPPKEVGNARVEFKVAKASGFAHDDELGCPEATKAGVVSDPVP